LKDDHIIIVEDIIEDIIEDIVDTGLTVDYLLAELLKQQPASVKVAFLLIKREVYKIEHNIDYAVFEILNKFAVGFVLLDYNQIERNYPYIYEKC
jgi:hypoxanthine phosphoribosyltransferase